MYKTQKCLVRQIYLHEWFFEHFAPSVQKHFKKKSKESNTKCALLLDNCSSHPMESKQIPDSVNIFVCFFPPNVTSSVQPIDQGAIANCNCLYRKQIL